MYWGVTGWKSLILTLGWFRKRTGTSVDHGARKSNNWLDQWQGGKIGTGSPRAFPWPNDVPVLLLTQSNIPINVPRYTQSFDPLYCSPFPDPKGRVFGPFWSENGYRLCPFWSGIGYGFRGNYGSVWTYLSFQFQVTKNEIEICEFEMHLKNFFVCVLI